MRKRVLFVLFVPLAGFLHVTTPAEAAEADAAGCVITEVAAVTGLDARGNEEVNGVATTLEGTVPFDVADTVTDVVTELMRQTEPVRTVVSPVSDGVVVTVRGVTGELPLELPSQLSRATTCILEGAASVAGDSPEASGGSAAAARECAVTSVVPVDAAGEATSAAAEVEGALIGVIGPLPVDLSATVADVFAQVGAATSDLAVAVVENVDGAQVTVTGVAGPLPVDLAGQLADALGCKSEAVPVPGDGGSEEGASGEAGGNASTSVKDSSVSASGSGSVSAQGRVASSSLPFTGMNSISIAGAGALLAGVGRALMRLRQRG